METWPCGPKTWPGGKARPEPVVPAGLLGVEAGAVRAGRGRRDSGGESVLVDWAFTGDGALGEDVGHHIPDSVFDPFLPAAL